MGYVSYLLIAAGSDTPLIFRSSVVATAQRLGRMTYFLGLFLVSCIENGGLAVRMPYRVRRRVEARFHMGWATSR